MRLEWIFAKKIVLCLLILLNVILFFLNSNQIQNYNIASHKKTDIIYVLQNFGLTLDPSIDLARSTSERLKVSSFSFTDDVISKAFFQDEEIVSVKNDNDTLEYESESFGLSLSGNTGLVKKKIDKTSQAATTLSTDEMIALADDTKQKLESVFGELHQTSMEVTESTCLIEYVNLHKGSVLFSNFFGIVIDNHGNLSIPFQYFDLIGTEVESKNIIGVDEALFSFMRSFQKEGYITNVTEGYYLPNQESVYFDDVELYLEPCYQISLQDDPTLYLIAGYSGERIL